MADQKKFTIAEIETALDIYAARVTKVLKIASEKQAKVLGVPKKQRKSVVQQNINKYNAGLVEIKFAIFGILKTGELPSVEELNKAKEDAGFIVPNQPPKDMTGKTFRKAKDSEVDGPKKIGEK